MPLNLTVAMETGSANKVTRGVLAVGVRGWGEQAKASVGMQEM